MVSAVTTSGVNSNSLEQVNKHISTNYASIKSYLNSIAGHCGIIQGSLQSSTKAMNECYYKTMRKALEEEDIAVLEERLKKSKEAAKLASEIFEINNNNGDSQTGDNGSLQLGDCITVKVPGYHQEQEFKSFEKFFFHLTRVQSEIDELIIKEKQRLTQYNAGINGLKSQMTEANKKIYRNVAYSGMIGAGVGVVLARTYFKSTNFKFFAISGFLLGGVVRRLYHDLDCDYYNDQIKNKKECPKQKEALRQGEVVMYDSCNFVEKFVSKERLQTVFAVLDSTKLQTTPLPSDSVPAKPCASAPPPYSVN